MKRRLLRMAACLLLCLAALPLSASADSGPKPVVSITVVNAPEEYYLDLLITDPGDYPNIHAEDFDPALLEGLKSWEGEGWYPALVEGTNVPLFGDLVPDEDGAHLFSYHGLPDTFRVAVSGPDGAQATEEPFTRQVFYTHSCPPFSWRGCCCGLSASGPGGTGWCSCSPIWPPSSSSTCGWAPGASWRPEYIPCGTPSSSSRRCPSCWRSCWSTSSC